MFLARNNSTISFAWSLHLVGLIAYCFYRNDYFWAVSITYDIALFWIFYTTKYLFKGEPKRQRSNELFLYKSHVYTYEFFRCHRDCLQLNIFCACARIYANIRQSSVSNLWRSHLVCSVTLLMNLSYHFIRWSKHKFCGS